ncbi:KR domain-containing protein, partial [candidate division KSB1 bacterium]|nr:KR domain-containing protein [candidate division KSB1 bacterium]NIS25216.1 KR domain-containing protein [candidate division KSB1 bacterium]NIT72124.1 KR domain-containing protein [candidate division KSB1 bacterium]NIU28678.1 KR domain-containing protein [candidate division KSB1 bacterium]NIU94435.1 KR domain-containing protein [candidate division KSB1 bacterium]
MVASADVSNLKEMEKIVNKAKERFEPINGVIHSAGIPGGGMIQLKMLASA